MSDPWEDPSAHTGWQSDLVDATAHKHRFTIPVEWEGETPVAVGTHSNEDTQWKYTAMRVTKLRCECGEETNR